MQRFKISDPMGQTVITVTVPAHEHSVCVHAEFHPLEQPEYVDALERVYRIEQITKDTQGHGCSIFIRLRPAQRVNIIEDMEAILADNYRGGSDRIAAGLPGEL